VRGACAILLAIGVLAAAPAMAESNIGFKAIEGRVGFVDIGEGDAGGTFIVSAFADLGMLSENIGLEAGVDFWSKGWDAGVCEWSWTNIGFVGDATYGFGSGDGSVRPYGFAGIALAMQSWDWDCNYVGPYYNDSSFDDSSMEFGFNFGVGAEFGSGDGMTPVARAGYNTNGGADYLYIQGGLRFPMGGN